MADSREPKQTAPLPAPFSSPDGEGSSEMTSERPTHVDRYEIRHELGRGAMGSVFAAWDPKLCREVAVKIVATQQRNNAKGRARFLREARSIAAIGQQNVVQIFDYSGLDSEALYLVMEKLEGRDLWELMHTHRLFPEAIAALVGHELCLALEAAHHVGIIHRDLKPENVFVTHQGRVVLTDFGIVKAIADDAVVEGYTERTEVIGTPGFMAPELLRGKSLTPATDVFALGALLYNIATLKMPYDGASPMALFQAAQKGEYIDPRRFAPQLSSAFCEVLRQCLQAHPSDRPASAAALRVALKDILDDLAEHRFGDDMLSWLSDPQGFSEESHRRAVAHLIGELTLAHARHHHADVERFKARLLSLDPFNTEWQQLLLPPPAPSPMAQAPSVSDPLLATAPIIPLKPKQTPVTVRAANARRSPANRWPRRVALAGVAGLALAVVGIDAWALLAHQGKSLPVAKETPSVAQTLPVSSPVTFSPAPITPAPRAVLEGEVDLSVTRLPPASLPASPATAVPVLAPMAPVAAPGGVPAIDVPRAPAEPTLAQQGAPQGMEAPAAASVPAEVAQTALQSEALSPPPAAGLGEELPRDAVAQATEATLDVNVEGRGAWLILDGHGIGHIHRKLLSLTPGRHRVVLVEAGRTLRRWILLTPGQHRSWQTP